MAVALFQQGSAGKLRDLDYVNPRPAKASSALPPDVRRRLGLDRDAPRANVCNSPLSRSPSMEVPGQYRGSANAEAKVGKSGAGTDWQNPGGHAFVRRGSGIPMSKRASRQSQLTGAGAAMIANQSRAAGPNGGRAPSREHAMLPPRPRPSSREATAVSRDCGGDGDQLLPFSDLGRQGSRSALRANSLGGC